MTAGLQPSTAHGWVVRGVGVGFGALRPPLVWVGPSALEFCRWVGIEGRWPSLVWGRAFGPQRRMVWGGWRLGLLRPCEDEDVHVEEYEEEGGGGEGDAVAHFESYSESAEHQEGQAGG